MYVACLNIGDVTQSKWEHVTMYVAYLNIGDVTQSKWEHVRQCM